MRNKVIIRADGNAKTGLGHLFRSFAIAAILEDFDTLFITASDSHLKVIPKNLNHLVLDQDLALGSELEWINKTIQGSDAVLILDGYHFDLTYQKQAKNLGFKIVYVDDFIRENYAVDVVLNHALVDSPIPSNQKFALGTDYALLRKEFLLEAKQQRVLKPIRNCFISFGGSDYNHLALKATKGALDSNSFEEIHIVSGLSSHEALIQEFDQEKQVHIHRGLNAKEMIQLMKKCELAILPCSTIMYEASCLGLLIIGGFYVDNQKLIYEGMKKNGLIFDAGDYNQMTVADFSSMIKETIDLDTKHKVKYLQNQQHFFDGSQIENLIQLIKDLD